MAFGIGSAIGLGTSLLGGLFGGPDKINTSRYKDQADKFGMLGDRFLNPNDSYYTDSINKQKQTLLDLYLAGVRQKKQQLASQGINSNAINSINANAGAIQAAEGANKFGVDLRREGVGFSQGFYGLSNQANNQFLNAEKFNADAGNSFKDQTIGGGLGLLGSVIGSEKGFNLDFLNGTFGSENFTPPSGGSFSGPYGQSGPSLGNNLNIPSFNTQVLPNGNLVF